MCFSVYCLFYKNIKSIQTFCYAVLEMLEWTSSGPTSKFFFEIWPQVNVPKIQDLFIIKDSVEIFLKF